MSKPKIISLGFATPKYSYGQREIFDALKYPQHFWRIFLDSGIEKRHFCVPLDRIKMLSFQEQQETYQETAVALSKLAILDCLDGRDPKEIGLFISNTCTGYLPGPVLGHYLAREFGFSPSTYIMSNVGMGCDGGFPGIKRAFDFTYSTGRLSLTLAIELCSLTHFPEPDSKPDPTNHWELLRSNALFGDGCSCALVGSDNISRHPVIIDTETNLDTRYLDDLGYTWVQGRLRVRLSKRVPFIAASLAKIVVEKLLNKHGLNLDMINHWIIHPAGSGVLDRIKDNLGLSEDKVALSREVLRNFGNTSSSSTGIIGKFLLEKERQPKGYCGVINIGPGMTSDMTLLKFGDESD